MTPYETLTRAQNLIRDPKNWTQGTYARDIFNQSIDELDPRATCFCSLGALYKTRGDTVGAMHYLMRVVPEGHIPRFNDNHTHEEVMEVWDKARELART